MLISKTETVTRTAKHSIELDNTTIRDVLNAAGAGIPEDVDVKIYFAVPGGGDWSNTDIDIDRKHPVYVEWTVTEERSV